MSSFDPLQLVRFRACQPDGVPLGFLFERDQRSRVMARTLPGFLRVQALHPEAALIGSSRLIQTRQRLVANADSLAALTWSDDEVDAAAVAYFAALGLSVTIAPNYLPGDARRDTTL